MPSRNALEEAYNNVIKEEIKKDLNAVSDLMSSFFEYDGKIPTKEEIIREMNQVVAMQKYAIYKHSKKIFLLHEELEPLLLLGSNKSWEHAYIKETLTLTEEEILLINKYILNSSFMSAWYDLVEDYEKRDKASDSCLKILHFLGLDYKEVFSNYYINEKLIKQAMIEKKINYQQSKTLTYIFIFLVIIVITFILK